MKKFSSLFRLENIIQELSFIIKRFPLSCIFIAALSICFLFLLHGDFSTLSQETLARLIFSLILGFFLSVSLILGGENYKLSDIKKYGLSALSLIFTFLFYINFDLQSDSFSSLLSFFISLFGIVGSLFFAAYIKNLWKREISADAYYQYFYKISSLFLFSAILGGLLFGLGAIAIGSVTLLFDINYQDIDKIYGDLAIFALSFFSPLFALTQVPKENEVSSKIEIPVFFSFLIKYVGLPFIYLYFAILYTYTFRVLLTFGDWPRGEISWLVVGFSSFGYFIYIFASHFEDTFSFAKIFRKYFPYAVLPQIAMLFYAIYLRIAQYDITTNRYFIVVFGLWLLCISLYFIFSKKKYLALIPTILTLFTILISIGPWSVYSLPGNRQMIRLEKNLTLAGILKDDTIIIPESPSSIEAVLSGEIYEGISYVCNLENCERIKERFPNQYAEILKKHREDFERTNKENIRTSTDSVSKEYFEKQEYQEPSSWEITSALSEILQIRAYYSGNEYNQAYNSYTRDSETPIFPLDTTGYSLLLQIQSSPQNLSGSGLSISYNEAKQSLELQENGKVIEEYTLSNFTKNLSDTYPQEYNNTVKKEDMTVSFTGKVYSGKVLFDSITMKDMNYEGEASLYEKAYWSGYVLLKKN